MLLLMHKFCIVDECLCIELPHTHTHIDSVMNTLNTIPCWRSVSSLSYTVCLLAFVLGYKFLGPGGKIALPSRKIFRLSSHLQHLKSSRWKTKLQPNNRIWVYVTWIRRSHWLFIFEQPMSSSFEASFWVARLNFYWFCVLLCYLGTYHIALLLHR